MWIVEDAFTAMGNEPPGYDLVMVGPFETEQAAIDYRDGLADDEDRIETLVRFVNPPERYNVMLADLATHRKA